MAKILIADDEAEILDLMKTILEGAGHKVATAKDGYEAMHLLKEEKPELLVLDVMMPNMDGYTLQITLSQDKDLCDIPVLVVTGLKSSGPLFQNFMQVALFLPKPFDASQLLDAVSKSLQHRTRK